MQGQKDTGAEWVGVLRSRGCYSYRATTAGCRLSASAGLAKFLRQRGTFGIGKDACKRRQKKRWATVFFSAQIFIASSTLSTATGVEQKIVGTALKATVAEASASVSNASIRSGWHCLLLMQACNMEWKNSKKLHKNRTVK